MRRGEIIALLVLALALLVLRAAYAISYPYDSDEPQHLHVAWAWAQGLLPYRDVFDNHVPLFHILSAPLVALIGESPRILILMRLAMIPFFAATLWGSFLLGKRLFGVRTGLWSAVVCGLSPTFFFKSLEYRSDALWAALWVLGIVVLLGGRIGAGRAFGAGLLFGGCLIVSLKSVMLLSALAIASVAIFWLAPRGGGDEKRRVAVSTLPVLAGLALPPAAIALYFAARGAFWDMIDCTVRHNLLGDVGRWGGSKRLYLLVPILALLLFLARVLLRRSPGDRARVAFLFLLAGSQYLLLSTVWPVHTRQDLLPFYPLFTVLLAGFLTSIRRIAVLAPAGLACVELMLLPVLASPTGDGTRGQETLLSQVLALTDRGDYVLDLKGQAVFRNRPFYYALETMTLERMARGLIKDTIPESCIKTRTCVAQADIGGFPPRARRFLEDNYVVVGAWRVAGRRLDESAADGEGGIPFELVIPARYEVVSEGGRAQGSLDGEPYDGPRELPPGRHVFVSAPGSTRLAVIWAQAAERGFTPFANPEVRR